MLDERALSTLYGMADLYIVGLGGGEQDRARREAERQAERRRLAGRYARYLVARAEVGAQAPPEVPGGGYPSPQQQTGAGRPRGAISLAVRPRGAATSRAWPGGEPHSHRQQRATCRGCVKEVSAGSP